jgi:hypothetical protein
MINLFLAKRSPVKTKEVINAEKKVELEKRLESVQNALGASHQKKMKSGKYVSSANRSVIIYSKVDLQIHSSCKIDNDNQMISVKYKMVFSYHP